MPIPGCSNSGPLVFQSNARGGLMTPISVINEWRSAFCLLVCSLPSSVFSLVSPLLSIMTNSSESSPSSTIYEEQRTNSPVHQPRPVRTMKRSVCSMGTFLLSQRQSFSQCSSSLPPVSSPLSLTRRIRADPLQQSTLGRQSGTRCGIFSSPPWPLEISKSPDGLLEPTPTSTPAN